jgi:DNA modification methylase
MSEYPPPYGTSQLAVNSIRDGRQLALDELSRSPQTAYSVRIDYDFPEQFVDNLSRQEVFNKHLFRPNTYLHKWWARRCGSTFRAVLKQFAPQVERSDYYTPGGLEGKTVLDPMMGGGTTLHEAIRLGANVVGADIDPIPVIQARASLTQAELTDLRAAFRRFLADLYGHLGHYFQTECPICDQTTNIQYSLYGMRKKCACRNVVQVDRYDLRHDGDRKIIINPYNWEISESRDVKIDTNEAPNLITKADKQCQGCGQQYAELVELPFYSRYTPIAIVAVCEGHGIFFRSPSESDRARIKQADNERSKLDFGPLEHFRVNDGPKSGDLLRHNIRSYLDVFSSRQLLYLHSAILQLHDYTGIDKLTLGTLVSTSLEFNSMLCGYKGWYKRRPGAIRHVFALHAYSFQYTALENNPVNPQKSSGNLQLLFHDRIERGRKWAVSPVERRIDETGKSELVRIPGEVDDGVEVFNQAGLTSGQRRFWLIQGDSQSLPIDSNSIDMIVTDPPYYDSVQYGNLAAFFRVWLERLLPDEAKWSYDETRSAVAIKATDGASNFMTTLSGIFAECKRVLKRHTGRMVFTFHHWDPGAWAELTIALKNAGFRLMNAYVVYSEHPISVHIRNLNSIRHDSVLVLAHDGNGALAPWTPLVDIDTANSETFCRQCGATLGWLLDSDLSQPEIRAIWEKLIRGNSNDRYIG